MKYDKCKTCRYKGRPRISFPCSRCKNDNIIPLTCKECRHDCNANSSRKSIIPCKDFEWD